jgi:hypothetical protein
LRTIWGQVQLPAVIQRNASPDMARAPRRKQIDRPPGRLLLLS